MRWQSYRALTNRFKLSRRIRIVSIAFVAIGSTSLVLGWANLYRTLVIGADARIALLDLADEQVALINILQPIAMLYAVFLCFVASRLAAERINRRAFTLLSAGFLILAAGEIEINSHSIYIDRFVSLIGTGNPVAIILPLFVVPIGAALYLWRFLMQLPPRHAVLFVSFGTIYVSGVLGAEMVSQSLALSHGYSSSAYTLAAGVEETLETIGIFGFCVAMSHYIQELCPKVFVTPNTD